MAFAKVSLVVTVKNEEQAIQKLLESVVNQTTKPNEVIISDAGSTDKTIKKIKSFQQKLNLKILNVSNSNRAEGRNRAISEANNKIIAVTDAGCILKNDWLELISKPIIQKKASAVAGFYLADCQTAFQCAAVPFVAIMPDKLDIKSYLPSSRSIAFTKKAWESAGKYPENVEYCEDLLFAKNLKSKAKMIVEPKAIVYWQQAKNLWRYYKQIKNYAQGDIEARYWPHITKIVSHYLRYIIFWAFPPLFLAYLYWPIFKHRRYITHPSGVIYLPIIQLSTDLAMFTGSLRAIL